MPKPTSRVKKMLTTPDGMFMSAAFLGFPTILAIRVAEYVVTTPLEMDSYIRWVNKSK